jgi:hypothetical protein
MAVVINLSDPGAVPGDSTNYRGQVSGFRYQQAYKFLIPDFRLLIPAYGVEIGSTRA